MFLLKWTYLLSVTICAILTIPIIHFGLKKVKNLNISSKVIDTCLLFNLPFVMYVYFLYIRYTDELSLISVLMIEIYFLFTVALFIASILKDGIAQKIIRIWRNIWK